MEHRERSRSLADDELLAGLSRIVGRGNQITAEFLAYLAELDQRQLFLDLGYPSLFDYGVKALGLCESTAGRHIAAARVCRSYPQALDKVARGDLHASALSLMKKHLTADNADQLFELCTRKSARQVEVLLAAQFPKPDVADSIRRLPTPNVGSAVAPKVPPTSEALAKSNPEAAEASNNEAPLCRPVEPKAPAAQKTSKPRRIEPLSADRFGVHFTADSEFCQLLERVRGLAAHRTPNGDLLTLLKRGLEAYERELEKERFAFVKKPRQSRRPKAKLSQTEPAVAEQAILAVAAAAAATGSASERLSSTEGSSPSKRTRRVPAAVRREVFMRDGRQCSYVSAEGRRCSSRRCLELDHVKPHARGGGGESANLRVLCRAHNQRYARQCFGELHLVAARARRLAKVRTSASTSAAPSSPLGSTGSVRQRFSVGRDV